MSFGITSDDVFQVYVRLKDKFSLEMTTTAVLDEGFTVDFPILVGKAHGQIIELYADGGMFILDVMDDAQTKGTHWHPYDIEIAVNDVAEFMSGKSDYDLSPFRMQQEQKTLHSMKLNPRPFGMIQSGQKTIELRLFDEKRQKLKAGDKIVFTNNVTGETLNAKIVKLHRFDSFEELYKTLPLLECGYTAEDVDNAQPSDMEQYYSAEEQKKYGVVGIELFLLTDESVV